MIHNTTAANENYAPGLLVTVSSMLTSINPDVELTLHFLNGGVSPATMNKMRYMCSKLQGHCTLVDIPINDTLFTGANLGPGNSYMAYARLLMGSLIHAPKVIYIDSDMVVLRDLSKIWDLNMQGSCALVCHDKKIKRIVDDCPIKLPDNESEKPYFNSGLLVIDLNLWRTGGYEKKSLDFSKSYHCELHDQTVLNYILKNNITFLEQEWNWPYPDVIRHGEIQRWNYHFSDKQKPWLYYGSNIKHKIWRYYYKNNVGNISKIFCSKKGIKGLIAGLKERLIRSFSIIRKAFFYIQKKRVYPNQDISGLIDFYWNDSLMISSPRERILFKEFLLKTNIKNP
jgi:lipopolysaccharide biosynthesis glycosyltransferase